MGKYSSDFLQDFRTYAAYVENTCKTAEEFIAVYYNTMDKRRDVSFTLDYSIKYILIVLSLLFTWGIRNSPDI